MTIAVITVHPDDETLGCGGTLLRHRQLGDQLYWVIVTTIDGMEEYPPPQQRARKQEIQKVAQAYGFAQVVQLGYPTTKLDRIAKGTLIHRFRQVLDHLQPEVLYVPYAGDAHSDHRIVAEALHAATKIFRAPYLRSVRAMEVLSETNFAMPDAYPFVPNFYVDISDFLERKIEIMQIYQSEMGIHPFPRSVEAIRALALLRGTESGYPAAEAFQILFERW